MKLGGDSVLGETGGESSYRNCSTSAVLCEPTEDSSGMAAKSDWNDRRMGLVGFWYMQLEFSGSYSSISIMLDGEGDRSRLEFCVAKGYCCSNGVSGTQYPPRLCRWARGKESGRVTSISIGSMMEGAAGNLDKLKIEPSLKRFCSRSES